MRFVIPAECFPLAWPTGRPRTKFPERTILGKEISLVAALEGVYRELRLMKVSTSVISSNLPRRVDGTPRGDQLPHGGDHGVAVYWTTIEVRAGQKVRVPNCISCDRWQHIRQNLRAVEMSLASLRGLERWGAVTQEQAFAGFTALPPGDPNSAPPAPAERPWREVLGVEGAWVDGAPPAAVLAYAKTRHRELIKVHHPDRGGDLASATAINRAMEQAEAELGGAS